MSIVRVAIRLIVVIVVTLMYYQSYSLYAPSYHMLRVVRIASYWAALAVHLSPFSSSGSQLGNQV